MILVLPSVRTKRKPTPFFLRTTLHIFEILSINCSIFQVENTPHLWWLILCVNLIGLRGAQRAGKTLFLCVSGGGGCFCKWSAFESVDWAEVYPHCSGLASPHLPRAQKEHKGKGRENFLFCLELGPPFSVLGHWNSWFLRQRQWPPQFLGLRT